jgi:hypothetical protein
VDPAGNAYVTGYTRSTNFPTANALKPTLTDFQDVFVTKINAAGTAFVYSTYLGGSGSEEARGIAVDTSGNAYIAGATFVCQQYHDLFNRQPEAGGLQFYLNILAGCQSGDNECIRYTRGAVVANFFRSPEMSEKGLFISYLYMVTLGHRPASQAELASQGQTPFERPHYLEFMTDLQSISDPHDDKAVVSAKKDALTSQLLQRTEIQQIYGALSNSQFVMKLEETAGVTLANRNQLIADLESATRTRAQVLRIVAESAEVRARLYMQAFITMEYFGLLRRDPDLPGYIFHNDRFRLVADPDLLQNFMVRGFIESPEYRGRFGT